MRNKNKETKQTIVNSEVRSLLLYRRRRQTTTVVDESSFQFFCRQMVDVDEVPPILAIWFLFLSLTFLNLVLHFSHVFGWLWLVLPRLAVVELSVSVSVLKL